MTEPDYRNSDDQSSAEDLDEDRLRVDPLEEGMDPPEHWTAADRFGTTAAEQRQGQDLEHRLREEEPDITPDDGARTDPDDLDAEDPIGELMVEPLPDENQHWRDAVARGQAADEAGGSVAEEIRTPRVRPQ
jgi:hypothetical protein